MIHAFLQLSERIIEKGPEVFCFENKEDIFTLKRTWKYYPDKVYWRTLRDVAQVVARLTGGQEAAGSSPVIPRKLFRLEGFFSF